VASYDPAGNILYQFADVQGSVIAQVNNLGQVTEKHGYTSYGLSNSLGTNTASYQYAGRRLDQDTGLYYNRARYYAPALGRFLNPDPIFIKGGLNLYAYTGNDPLNRMDPSGHASMDMFSSWSQGSNSNYLYDHPYASTIMAATMIIGLGPEDPAADAAVAAEAAITESLMATESSLEAEMAVNAGNASLWDTSITNAGSRYLNVQTNIGAQEFQSNLISNGYNIVNETNSATILSNDVSTYTMYMRTSNGLPGAQFFGETGSTIKYTLGGP